MKITITTTYNGRQYDGLRSAIKDSIVDRINERVQAKLEPFKSELSQFPAGSITVDVAEDLSSYTIKYKDLPDELVERIINSTQPD